MSKILQFLIPFVIYVTSIKAFSSCRLTDGRLLSNGTSAFVSCDTQCTCLIYTNYYHVLCEATCMGNMTTPGCSWVRKPGDFCCVHGQCPSDVKLDQCSTVTSATGDETIPWHIRIENEGVETCAGVMVPPSRRVITKTGCADENSILIGNNGKSYATQVLKNEPNHEISTLIAVNSHKNIMPGFHDINPAPDENFCRSYPAANCALFVSFYDPRNGGKSGRLAGVLSNDTRCVSKGRSPKTKCVQVAQSSGVRRNLTSGSGVYVQVNGFPYLIGILALDQTCSHEGPTMIPFYDVCNDIENSK